MKIVVCATGEEFEGVIERASEADLRRVKRGRQFGFDWMMYGNCDVYKLTISRSAEIAGLMAIQEKPFPGFQFVELVAIECNKPNIGARKKYHNIAGCLIAYACKLAFDNGCDGYVRVQPKTVLYNHYINNYGFMPMMGTFLISSGPNSKKLVEKFLGITM